jgi:hypothetical protein
VESELDRDSFGLGPQDRETLLDWVGEHLTEVRRSVDERRPMRFALVLAFVIGFAAHVVGFVLKSSPTGEPVALVADLLYGLGWSLWTGVVVVVFVQILPEWKRRQLERALRAYEAERGRRARSDSRRNDKSASVR